MARLNDLLTDILPIWRRTAESGGALPSVEALAEELGMSRVAVREALIQMEADGLVRRHHGSGTFPNPAALEMLVRFDQHMDFTDRFAAVGFESRVEIIEAAITDLGSLEAPTRLEVDPSARVLRTVKRWWADDIVAVVAVDVVPLSRRADEEEVLASLEDAVVELATQFGLGKADWMCTWPSAVELDAPTAKLLDYEEGRAALRTEQLGVERLGATVFHAVEHHRPEIVEHGMIRTIYT